jgi:hypothetical protein
MKLLCFNILCRDGSHFVVIKGVPCPDFYGCVQTW